MPSAHRPIFYRKQKIGVKINSCVLTFGPIKNRTFPSDNLSVIKNQSVCTDFSSIKNLSDVNQQWNHACHCHSTITLIKKSRAVCAK